MKATFHTLAALLLLPVLSAQVEEGEGENEHKGKRQVVEDTYVDGTVRARYTVDAKGNKTGSYERFYRDGELRLRAHYYNNILHGRYETFDRDGERNLQTSYKNGKLHGSQKRNLPGNRVLTETFKDGKLHGARELLQDGGAACKQQWKQGTLVQFNGVSAFPVPLAELQKKLQEIQVPPKQKPEGTDKDPKLPQRLAALRRLQAYRYLCGLPYEEMVLDPDMNKACDAGAEICRQIGGLNHRPAKPAGMDDDFYRLAFRGTSHSNLAAGRNMAGSVDAYMNDSDASNIGRIGHRRWCLNPAMRKTGFGSAARYSAMWSFDASGGSSGVGVVYYPPRGYVPVDFFGPRHAWCICTPGGGKANLKDVRVVVTPLDETYLPGKPLTLDHLTVLGGGAGIQNLIVFRPVGVQVGVGRSYWVRVSTDGGKSDRYRYLVQYTKASPIRLRKGSR